MTNITEREKLERKIEKMRAEFDYKEQISALLPGIELLAYLSEDAKGNYSKRAVYKAKTIEDCKRVLDNFPPSNETVKLGAVNDRIINAPYRISCENPAQYKRLVKIGWQSEDLDMSLEFPEGIIAEFLVPDNRHLYSSEYHYFPNRTDLNRVKIHCKWFKAEQVKFYGGSTTLVSETEINNIIQFLTK